MYTASQPVYYHYSNTCGDLCRIRTCDLVLRRHLLYPAELRDQQKYLVLAPGLEPGRLTATDFKSVMSTIPSCEQLVLVLLDVVDILVSTIHVSATVSITKDITNNSTADCDT